MSDPNPSSRWKNEAVQLAEDYDFQYVGSYDAGREFRQEDHCCDFCGTHLRYTAVIVAEQDEDIEREVGLDCLEHIFGTSWSKLQDVERDIKDLKERAKMERRKEKFQEEYGNLIDWIEKYLYIKENNFLRSMYNVLTTGSREFTRKMEEAVKDIYDETDLEEMREEQKEKEKKVRQYNKKIGKLQDLIVDVDDVEVDSDYEPVEGDHSALDFVNSVSGFLENRGYLTDNQLEALNDIFARYKDKKED